ncbi:benzoate/H(+) symporter BenE family transporter [Sorangium sp. So ce834]|uniref:benzoate/H(+) symporter BenE family transporter n=1 Tax=Sorangium sp. So ce834 TaxID=3133321 RepID=UPI003F5FAE03
MPRTVTSSIPLSVVVAGFITVLVGFTSAAAIVFQAASAAGATPAELSSWMGALGLGMGVTCIGLSLRYRAPVVTAWSTPGAALLVTSLAGVSMAEAIGAFVLSAALITICGLTGWFERVIDRIPLPIASAMLAGVLVRFGMDVFTAMKTRFLLVFSMFFAYLLCKRLWPRYAVIVVLFLGVGVSWWQGLLRIESSQLTLTTPTFVMPTFSWPVLISVGIPLFVVTMASQNLPGVVVIRGSGYATPVSPLITWTGITTLLLAPFGCFALNLAAITAAICMGKEAHEDPAKRYLASVAAGVFYLLVGVFGGAVGMLFTAFPRELVLAVAGLALLGTIASGLSGAMRDERAREPALITFLVTASGVSLFGIGAAFWGLVTGVFALAVLNWFQRAAPAQAIAARADTAPSEAPRDALDRS